MPRKGSIARGEEAAELAGFRHLAAEHFPVVFARHHGLRSRDEGGEESIEFFEVHCLAALTTFEEVTEAVEFGVGQRVVLGEGSHLGKFSSAVYDTTSIGWQFRFYGDNPKGAAEVLEQDAQLWGELKRFLELIPAPAHQTPPCEEVNIPTRTEQERLREELGNHLFDNSTPDEKKHLREALENFLALFETPKQPPHEEGDH